MYHIHELPVPANGTKDHMNPSNGVVNATDASHLECGDLSGKHGTITGTEFEDEYTDDYLSLNPENKAYVGGLLVVIYFANKTRISFANITAKTNSSISNPGNETNTTSLAVGVLPGASNSTRAANNSNSSTTHAGGGNIIGSSSFLAILLGVCISLV